MYNASVSVYPMATRTRCLCLVAGHRGTFTIWEHPSLSTGGAVIGRLHCNRGY
jgi:hypothetical protein